MKWQWMLLGSALVVLIACGGSSSSGLTADQVHRSWVQAVQSNDREQARALLVAENHQYLDAGMSEFQSEMQPAALGPLTGVIDVQPPIAQGKGYIGISVWPFTRRTICYRTSLAETEQGWKVTAFSRTACS